MQLHHVSLFCMNWKTCFYQSDFYLSYKIALKSHICAGDVRKRDGKNISESLCLMDDSVREGQVHPVLCLHLTAANHPAQLCLDLLWIEKRKESTEAKK